MPSVPIGARDQATVTMMTTADGAIRGVHSSMPMAAYHPTRPPMTTGANGGFGASRAVLAAKAACQLGAERADFRGNAANGRVIGVRELISLTRL
jgi:hypothetical protein